MSMLSDPIEALLEETGIERDEVYQVLLVGGSSRIPYIRQWLQDSFQEATLNDKINPDEAVAIGAAI